MLHLKNVRFSYSSRIRTGLSWSNRLVSEGHPSSRKLRKDSTASKAFCVDTPEYVVCIIICCMFTVL